MESTLRTRTKVGLCALAVVVLIFLGIGYVGGFSPVKPAVSTASQSPTSTPNPNPPVTVRASHLEGLGFTEQSTLSPDALFANGGTLDPEFREDLVAAGFDFILRLDHLTAYVHPTWQGNVVAWVSPADQLVAYQIANNGATYVCLAPTTQQLVGTRRSVEEYAGHAAQWMTLDNFAAPGVALAPGSDNNVKMPTVRLT